MECFKICVVLSLVALTCASPAKPSFWKGTILDANVEEMRSLCAGEDPIACLKLKALAFLDTFFQKDNFQLSDNVEVTKNSYRSNEVAGRSDNSFENNVEEYIKSHDVKFKLPLVGSTVTLDSRNLDNEEIGLKLNFDSGSEVQARKSKLKKIIVPILIFVLLKAMTLIPLALGVLGLKAWNALQLSFFSFVVSVALAVFQLCKKIAADNAHPAITAHGPWESGYAARSFQGVVDEPQTNYDTTDAQQMAYSAYVQQ